MWASPHVLNQGLAKKNIILLLPQKRTIKQFSMSALFSQTIDSTSAARGKEGKVFFFQQIPRSLLLATNTSVNLVAAADSLDVRVNFIARYNRQPMKTNSRSFEYGRFCQALTILFRHNFGISQGISIHTKLGIIFESS